MAVDELNLAAGLIGAVIGGAGSIIAAQMTIKALYREEENKSVRRRMDRKKAMMRALRTETRENLQLNEKGEIRSRKVLFANEAWSVYKNMIYTLPDKLQKALIIAYNEVKIFNSIIMYDMANRSFRGNSWVVTDDSALTERPGVYNETEIETQAAHVRKAFTKVREEMDKLKV